MTVDLKIIELFSNLPPQVLLAVKACVQVKTVKKGNAIIWAEDDCLAVYFIIKGWVEIFRLSDGGREQMIERLGAGEGFNLVPLFLNDSKNQANVRALTTVDLMLIHKHDFQLLMEQYPELVGQVAQYFANRLKHMLALVENLALLSVRQRLAAFLIQQADQPKFASQPRWTQEQIACHLGTVRDVVGRILRQFEENGLLRFQRQYIQLLDCQALHTIIKGEE